MRKFNSLTVALILGLVGSTTASAQSLRSVGEPAEFPPASYTGKQYVDSRGCVYIRAGISGNTTWVPRVTRGRNAVCGMQPSLVAKKKAPAATTAPAKRVVKAAPKPAAPAPTRRVAKAPTLGGIFAPKPLDTVASIKAKPTPQRVVQGNKIVKKPATQQRVVSVRKVPAGQPKVIQRNVQLPTVQQPVTATRRVATAPKQVVRKQASTNCSNASAFSRQYINQGSANAPVRCGPQAGPIVTAGTGRAVSTPPTYPLGAEVQQPRAPQRVVQQRTVQQRTVQPRATQRVTTQRVKGAVRRTTNVQIPAGYRHVWSDDRLNQLRAQVTAAGNAQTDLVWTRTVPRRLIDTKTRSDVTKLFARLRYPYTNLRAQDAADYNTRISTKSIKTPVPKKVVRQAPKKAVVKAAPRKPAAAAVNGKYVQIGTFGSPANVQKNVNRLKASGMPVRVANVTRKGKKLQIVLAGPFTSSSSTSNALRALRGAGYSDAFVR